MNMNHDLADLIMTYGVCRNCADKLADKIFDLVCKEFQHDRAPEKKWSIDPCSDECRNAIEVAIDGMQSK